VKHLEALKANYRTKRDATLAALGAHLKETADLHWTHPNGGLYVWLTLPEHIDTSRRGKLFERCVERGVLFVPGAYSFHPDALGKVPNHHLRLCYGQTPMEEIAPGIERLAVAIREQL
jgi:2-aminoadipate transaminase